jgi:hypothetical protein
MAFTATVSGLDKIQEALKQLGSQATKIVGAALYEGCELTMTDCKIATPVLTGTLRNTGRVEQPVVNGKQVSVLMGFGGPAAPYAQRVHDGVGPKAGHGEIEIVAKNKQVLACPIQQWRGKEVNPYGSGKLPCLSKDGNFVILGKRVHPQGFVGRRYLVDPVKKNIPMIADRVKTAVVQAAVKQLQGEA